MGRALRIIEAIKLGGLGSGGGRGEPGSMAGPVDHLDILKMSSDREKKKMLTDQLQGALSAGLIDLNAIRKLVDQGADVNVSNDKGVTPLMYACAQNRSTLADHFLKYGADPNAQDHHGFTLSSIKPPS